jgi:hypothetical protein
MRRALPGSEYYGGSAPPRTGRRSARPARRPRRMRGSQAGPGRFPCSLRSARRRRSPARSLRPHHGYPAALHRGLPASHSKPAQEFPAQHARRVRAAPGPYPPDLSRCVLKRRKRRFLAYSFPPRSPGPGHLAVLTRPGFVRAACHPPRHHPGRAALSFTSLLRQGRRRRSLTSTRTSSASRRTERCTRIAGSTLTAKHQTRVGRRRRGPGPLPGGRAYGAAAAGGAWGGTASAPDRRSSMIRVGRPRIQRFVNPDHGRMAA